jgi:hypothetical protein
MANPPPMKVQAPDGSTVSFPTGTPDNQVSAFMRMHYGNSEYLQPRSLSQVGQDLDDTVRQLDLWLRRQGRGSGGHIPTDLGEQRRGQQQRLCDQPCCRPRAVSGGTGSHRARPEHGRNTASGRRNCQVCRGRNWGRSRNPSGRSSFRSLDPHVQAEKVEIKRLIEKTKDSKEGERQWQYQVIKRLGN